MSKHPIMAAEQPTRWVHRTIVASSMPSELLLDGLSAEGWELVTVMQQDDRYRLILRRREALEPR